METYLDKPSDSTTDKTRKIHDDYIHDFVFDDGHIQNIYLLDKKNIARNKVQVIKQFEQTGTHANRYDVTIKSREIDLLIVVGMFLTSFDAPTLNTLFVDKNLRYHGLIQAYSRTNRIFDATKTFGNIHI